MTHHFLGILALITTGLSQINKPVAQKEIPGIWIKYKQEKVVEIFNVRPNHQFISNLFNNDGHITGIEKGAWNLKGDSISFTFNYTVELKKDGTYTVEKGDMTKPVKMPISIKSKLMVIGRNEYRKD